MARLEVDLQSWARTPVAQAAFIESGTLPSLADNTQVSQCGKKLDFTSISSKTFKVEEKA
ncbi:hypothetical protein HBH61_176290 [Parastagonospora nodorum]|nr:hypothetical protein HBH49_129450 [Parastagonospora nodorum]KAH4804308.1 hypothetical protein HBH61_176290 [Parastagonospora nodorum]